MARFKYLITAVITLLSFSFAQGQANQYAEEGTLVSMEEGILNYTKIQDTIVIAPTLNGDLDTSNYYMMPELIEIRAEKTVQIFEDGKLVERKIPAEYMIVEVKFFPFKDILDITNISNIIPAEIKIIQRWVLAEEDLNMTQWAQK